VNELSKGFYGWRTGWMTEISLPNGIILRPLTDSNPGSVAVLYYFSSLAAHKALQKIPVMQRPLMDTIQVKNTWQDAVSHGNGFASLYIQMFNDPWERAELVEPLFPAGTRQPELELPFEPGYVWSYTSGPHKAWQTEGANGALDFAPSSKYSGCVPSKAWVTAAADGPVVRTGDGFVIQDLDEKDSNGKLIPSDNREQTGWTILYMHIQTEDKVPEGTYLKVGDYIGHPSCEGGPATGTHLHIARKFNGEWVQADGPLPFVMSGWSAHAGNEPYQGTLTKDGRTVTAHPWGSYDTLIWHGGDIELPVYSPKPAKPESPNDKIDR
jgi:murein DD-endopeptidase MepM/ murein hydrolase activator NlpD